MAIEIESVLLSTAVSNRDLKSVVNSKVTEKFFYGNENKLAFRYLLDYFREYGGMPTKDTFLSENPGFNWNCPGEPIAYWIKKIQRRQKKNIIVTYGEQFWKALEDDDVEGAITSLKEGIDTVNLEVVNTEDSDWTEGAVKRAKEIKALGKRKGMLGIPTPWPMLNDNTQGWKDGELTTIYGRPGTGKTWSICLLAFKAWQSGFKPLIISKEMVTSSIERRLDSLRTRIAHERIRSGKLTSQDTAVLFVEAQELENSSGSLIISSEETLDGSGLSNVSSKIQEYKPDIVFIDGVYLLQDEHASTSKVEALVRLTQGLKRMLKVHKIPGIVSAQANRATVGKSRDKNLTGVQWSDSFSSDSDMLIRMFQTESMRAKKQMGHALEKQRDGKIGLFYTNWDFEKMDFDEQVMTAAEQAQIEKEQDAEAREA